MRGRFQLGINPDLYIRQMAEQKSEPSLLNQGLMSGLASGPSLMTQGPVSEQKSDPFPLTQGLMSGQASAPFPITQGVMSGGNNFSTPTVDAFSPNRQTVDQGGFSNQVTTPEIQKVDNATLTKRAETGWQYDEAAVDNELLGLPDTNLINPVDIELDPVVDNDPFNGGVFYVQVGKELTQSNGEWKQMTLDELEDFYNEDPLLEQTFGDFDNYASYMGELAGLYDSNALARNWEDAYQDSNPYDAEGNLIEGRNPLEVVSGTNEQNNLTDAVAELNEKYGLPSARPDTGTYQPITDENGDKYQWNGTSYTKTWDKPEQSLWDQVFKAGVTGALGLAFGGAASGALAGALGPAGSGAVSGALGSAVSGAVNGEGLDLGSIAAGALTGGLLGYVGGMGGLPGDAISPELQNSLDILRESNPERYLEALEILNNATQQGGSWLDALGGLADIGVEVGSVVWDANNNDGRDAAEPTVDDNGELIFDGGDVSVNIPDYSMPDDGGGGGGGGELGGGVEIGEAPPWGWVFDELNGEWNPVYSEEEAVALPGDPDISVGESKPGEDYYGDYVGEGQVIEESPEQAAGEEPEQQAPDLVFGGLPNIFTDSTDDGGIFDEGTANEGTDNEGSANEGSGNGNGGGNGDGNGDGDGDGDGDGLGNGLGLLAGLGGGGSNENYKWQPIAGLTRLSPYQKRRHTIYNSLNEGLLKAALQQSGRA